MQVRFLQGTIPLRLPQIIPQTDSVSYIQRDSPAQLLGIIELDLVAPGLRGLSFSLITPQPLDSSPRTAQLPCDLGSGHSFAF